MINIKEPLEIITDEGRHLSATYVDKVHKIIIVSDSGGWRYSFNEDGTHATSRRVTLRNCENHLKTLTEFERGLGRLATKQELVDRLTMNPLKALILYHTSGGHEGFVVDEALVEYERLTNDRSSNSKTSI